MIFANILVVFSFIWAVLGKRSLIVYDAESIDLTSPPSDVKSLVNYLKSHDYETLLRGYNDDDLRIFAGDESLFDNIVLLPTSSKKILNKQELNKNTLVKLLNQNVDIITVGDDSKNYPDDIREFLNGVGIYPSPKGYKLVDHFTSNDKVQLTSQNLGAVKILSDVNGEYDGQSAIIDNNPHLIPIVTSSATSFATNDMINSLDNDNSWGIGQQSFIIVGLQSLSGGRLTWIGSSELITDELLSWSLSERNVLKLQFVQHFKNDAPELINKTLYRIKDQVIYTIGVSELINNEWKPFVVDPQSDDALQLSFKMLDPYQRLNLQPLGEVSSIDHGPLDTFAYFVNFTIPDQHGMFTFELDYKRLGYNYLLDKKIVAVRHLANDEFKRSWEITNSWYYIASAIFVVIGWFMFVVSFIYVSKDDTEKKNI